MMTRPDTAITYYHSLKPTQFSHLTRFEITQSDESGRWETQLQIELASREEKETQNLILHFVGVRNLKYVPASDSILYFSYIEILPLYDAYWEDVHYKVFETEQDTDFSFLCREFEARLLKTQ